MAREVEPPDLRDRLARLHLVAEIDEATVTAVRNVLPAG